MTADRIAPAFAVALIALGAAPALARPHAVTASAVRVPARPGASGAPTVTHRFVLPTFPAQRAPVYVPVYGFSYGAPFGFGYGAPFGFGTLGLNPRPCSAGLPATLGDLGSAGPNSGFAPVALRSTLAFETLPPTQSWVAPSMYCQPPAADWSALDVGQ